MINILLLFGAFNRLLVTLLKLFYSRLLPRQLLKQLLFLTLLSLPLQLLDNIILTLSVRSITKIALSQIIPNTFAHLHVVEHTCTIELFIGVFGLLTLRMTERNVCLVTDQVAIACILRVCGLLLGARELFILNEGWLWLNLELGILIICTIQFLNFVNIINLRLVQLMVRFSVLKSLTHLENSSTIGTHGWVTCESCLTAETLLWLKMINLISIFYNCSLFVWWRVHLLLMRLLLAIKLKNLLHDLLLGLIVGSNKLWAILSSQCQRFTSTQLAK